MGLAWLMFLDHHETLAVQLQLHHLWPEFCEMKWHLQIHQYWWKNAPRSLPVWNTNIHSARLQSQVRLRQLSLWNHALDFSTSLCHPKLLHAAQCSATGGEGDSTRKTRISSQQALFWKKVDKKHRQHNSHRQRSPWTWSPKPLIMVSWGEPR